MIRTISLIALIVILGACKTLQPGYDKFVLDESEFIEAVYLAENSEVTPLIMERIEPIAMAGQLKPVTKRTIAQVPRLKPDLAIDQANAGAAIEPDENNFINAIQIYPYTIGALYQVYTAPNQVTDIALQPGEELMSVSAGDTLNWIVGDTISGSGEKSQVHILIKPRAPSRTTNLLITTSVRTYHIELQSYRETYMAAVSWRYPNQDLAIQRQRTRIARSQSKQPVERDMQLDRLNFRYEIVGDKPHWRPLRAFDDGRKVFIQFPDRLDQGEAPPLFVVGRNGDSQLVNYRVNGTYYIIDRLFASAELRLGEKNQEVVRIVRTRGATNELAGL